MTQKRGSIALADVAAKATHIELACTRCQRRGRYQLARLVARLGPDFAMTELGAELVSCSNRTEAAPGKRCDVYFPGLTELVYGPLKESDDDAHGNATRRDSQDD